MHFTKRLNLVAVSLTAATFVVLSMLPLTRNNLRFDMQMAAGKPVFGSVLKSLGVKQSELPFAGIGPSFRSNNDEALVKPLRLDKSDSRTLAISLAHAMQLSGRDKWNAMQQLVADFPDSPAAHAALLRIACKSGGAVGVGHDEEQTELTPPSAVTTPSATVTHSKNDPRMQADALIMLRSCGVGEQIDSDNAYFPAMAAIAYYAIGLDEAALAALHRAAEKPHWREYISMEIEGQMQEAELRQLPENSLTQSMRMAGILFPHYATLRSMARVATVQAMHAEQSGDIPAGLSIRGDIARLSAKMRSQSSSLVGSLVGISLIGIAEQRPGGVPMIHARTDGWPSDDQMRKDAEDERRAANQKADAQFLAYLEKYSTSTESEHWKQLFADNAATKDIARRAPFVSAFGAVTMFQTEWKVLSSLIMLCLVILLSVIGGLAHLHPYFGRKLSRVATGITVAFFGIAVLWVTWNAAGNIRDIVAFGD